MPPPPLECLFINLTTQRGQYTFRTILLQQHQSPKKLKNNPDSKIPGAQNRQEIKNTQRSLKAPRGPEIKNT